MEIINIDIGGTNFRTTKSTLARIGGSRLAQLDTGNQENIFFDRDPALFGHILNAYRSGEIHIPRDVCPIVFKKELLYWKLPLHLISPCCWKYFYDADGDLATLRIILEAENNANNQNKICQARASFQKATFSENTDKTTGSEEKETTRLNSSKQNVSKIWLFLDNPTSSTVAKIWFFIYISVVLVSVLVFIIWLDPSIRVEKYLSSYPEGFNVFANRTLYEFIVHEYNEKLLFAALSDPHPMLLGVDIACVIFFILETMIHFMFCPNKVRYFFSIRHILKLVLCLTMTTSTILEFRKDLLLNNFSLGWFYFTCKSFNVFRLCLIFRLHLIYNGLHIILLSVKQSFRELLLLMFCFAAAVIVYGCLMFSVEINTDMFPSTQVAMWWSLITMTTIGYGDYYPTCALGYIVGMLCAISGLIVLAMPIAAIAGTFSNFNLRNADYQKHKFEIERQEKLSVNVVCCTDETKQQGNDNENKTTLEGLD